MRKNIVVVVLAGLVVLFSTLWIRELQHSKVKEKKYQDEIEQKTNVVSTYSETNRKEEAWRISLTTSKIDTLIKDGFWRQAGYKKEDLEKEILTRLLSYPYPEWGVHSPVDTKEELVRELLKSNSHEKLLRNFVSESIETIRVFEEELAEIITQDTERGLGVFFALYQLKLESPRIKEALYNVFKEQPDKVWRAGWGSGYSVPDNFQRLALADRRIYALLSGREWDKAQRKADTGKKYMILNALDERSNDLLMRELFNYRCEDCRIAAFYSLQDIAEKQGYPESFLNEIVLRLAKTDPSFLLQLRVIETIAKHYIHHLKGKDLLVRRWKYSDSLRSYVEFYAPQFVIGK